MSTSTRALKQSIPGFKHFLRRFGPLVRTQRGLVAGATGALIFEVALRLLEPWPLKFVLDQVLGTGKRDDSRFGSVNELDPDLLLALCAGAVVAVAALRALFAYASTVGLAIAGNRILTEVRAELYAHVQRLSLSWHDRTKRGDLIHRLVADVGRLQEVAVTAALPLVANCLTLVGMVGVMMWLNWQLALVAVLAFPLFWPALARRGGQIKAAARKQRRQEGAMASHAAESLGAIRVVQAFSLEGRLERAFAGQNKASLREGVKAKRLAAGLERTVDVLVAIGVGMVLWFGAHQVRVGALTPGELVVFMLYLKTAFKPMRDLAKYTGRLASASASAERILDLLDTEPEIRDRPGAVHAPRFAGSVRLEDVNLSYGRGRDALHAISIEAEPGQRVALVGPSGAGKSSIALLIPRLYDVTSGRVVIDGRDIRDYTLASLRGQVALVLQESVLFGMTVRENIAFGSAEMDDAAIEDAARLANAHDFIAALPDGYDTVLGERGATLSGGQRQRIAIARAAVRDAAIVILDEPGSGLDEESERAVSEALNRLTAGRTTFLISHALRRVEDADVIHYLEGGRVLESGTHAELMDLDGCYAAVWRLQASGAPEADLSRL